MSLKTENSSRVAKSRPVCMGLNKTGTITQVNMPILAWSQPCKEIALSKGLRRVSRSGKFSQSLIFSTKMSKKSRFSSKDFNFKFRKITEFFHTFCVEEVIHKMNKERWLWNCSQFLNFFRDYFRTRSKTS
jgi:hypothetical protein